MSGVVQGAAELSRSEEASTQCAGKGSEAPAGAGAGIGQHRTTARVLNRSGGAGSILPESRLRGSETYRVHMCERCTQSAPQSACATVFGQLIRLPPDRLSTTTPGCG